MVDTKLSTLGTRPEHGTMDAAAWTTEVQRKGNPRAGKHMSERTHCNHGHEFTPENTGTRSDGKGRVCRQCKTEASRKRRSGRTLEQRKGCSAHGIPWKECVPCQKAAQKRRDAKKLAERKLKKAWVGMPEASRTALFREARKYNGGLTPIEDGGDIKKNALDAFKLTPEQAEAQAPLQFELDRKGRPKCEENPEAYFFEPDATVTDQYAEAMCEGCPLMGTGLCLDYAKTYASPHQIMIAEGKVLMGTELRVRGEE